jgi:hypothetical protein
MNTQLTDLEGGVIIDESHHIPYVVWSSAVERLVVAQDVAGSNPVTPPITAFRFTGERFTEPLRLRSYQIDALRQLRGLSGIRPVVAQLVERRPEEPGVAGSIPARGTKLKL